ncbi:MAG TPA: TetR/AcrR family transcriptional regulator [Longimicrobium sp.]|nr:TetR/AcrR family transcriptional regulator [Longimicrobium sp.]
MFTDNNDGRQEPAPGPPPRRGRGRPPGATPQGEETRRKLYRTAINLFATRGYEETTLREIAAEAGASPGLLYRYFPSKRAVVLALYDELSREFQERARHLPAGRWRDRFAFALETSLDVLRPHRGTLVALVPVLVGGRDEGLFAPATAFSRERVQSAFVEAASRAADAPAGADAEALGRALDLVHLAVLLFWLLDRSSGQRATEGLVALIRRVLPPFGVAFRLRVVRGFVRALDALAREAFYGPAGAQ